MDGSINGVRDTEYAKFLLHFVRPIVGDTAYATNIMKELIPTWVNTTDEALAIILVENCWQQECDIHFRGKKSPDEFVRQNKNKSALGEVELDIREKARSCRWSNGGPGSTGSQGWSKAGIVRFNELLKIIGRCRAS
jgi:hypothetical protein